MQPRKLEMVHSNGLALARAFNLPPPHQVNATGVGRERRLSPILKAIAFTVLLPFELSFFLGDLRLTLIRVIFVILTPVLLIRACNMLVSGRLRILLTDFLVVSSIVWMCVATAVVNGIEATFAHTAPVVLEYFGGYLAMRVLLSEHGQALRFINLLCYVIIVVSLLGMADTVTGSHTIHDHLRDLTGNDTRNFIEYRVGLVRASGVMEHPILYGAVCAFGLLLAINTQIRGRYLAIFVFGLGTFLSLSAGPIQAAVLGSMLIAYDRMFERLRSRWKIIIVTGLVGIGAIYSITNSPLNWVFGHLTFDPGSGWSRIFEWDTVGNVIAQSPWFGVAYNWATIVKNSHAFMFVSIDLLWLLFAVTYGIPGAIITALSIISASFERVSGARVNLTPEEQRLARTLSIILWVIVFLGFTVDFWGSAFILIGIFMGVRVHLSDLGKRGVSARRQPASSAAVPMMTLGGAMPLSNPG